MLQYDFVLLNMPLQLCNNQNFNLERSGLFENHSQLVLNVLYTFGQNGVYAMTTTFIAVLVI